MRPQDVRIKQGVGRNVLGVIFDVSGIAFTFALDPPEAPRLADQLVRAADQSEAGSRGGPRLS
jgi:hypothetical protein